MFTNQSVGTPRFCCSSREKNSYAVKVQGLIGLLLHVNKHLTYSYLIGQEFALLCNLIYQWACMHKFMAYEYTGIFHRAHMYSVNNLCLHPAND